VVAGPGRWIPLAGVARTGSQKALFERVRYSRIDPAAADASAPIQPRSRVRFELEISAQEEITAHSLALTIYSRDGSKLMNFDTVSKGVLVRLRPGNNRFEIHTDAIPLNSGTYAVGFWLEPHRGVPPADWIECAFQMEVAAAAGENPWNKPFSDGHVVSAFEFLAGAEPVGDLSVA
jgi:hypothetical protein